MGSLLQAAEELEKYAAEERIAYMSRWLDSAQCSSARILDAGCGNGYAVDAWLRRGVTAIGIDISPYRLGRWSTISRDRKLLVLADAANLPFCDAAFGGVVSSGMIEHIGVIETSAPYRVTAQPAQHCHRLAVVAELSRVASPEGPLLLDCPNGHFPIDFWHGDQLGACRLHSLPDALCPSFKDFQEWARAVGRQPILLPASSRLKFRQIRNRWWGRALSPLAKLYLAFLDTLLYLGFQWLPTRLHPYLVVSLRT